MPSAMLDWLKDFALEWSYVFTMVFMAVLIFFFWRALRVMPKTKPQEIKPESKVAIGWDDIAGVDEAKDELREVVEFLRESRRFTRLGAHVPKGVLLHGPPGTGKTLLAKAVAHESGAHFYSQSASAFVEMFAGLGAARIRRLFPGGAQALPGHPLHRRAGRGRGPARDGRLRRARADPQPAAGGDGRLSHLR